jgi:RNA polymerase sigma factor (sigma-70 family)
MYADDDATLIRFCRAGDQEAWELLVRRYQRLIYTVPRRAGLNEELAAEVFQSVCIALFEHLDRIRQPDRLGAWLVTTARRETLRQLRRERAVAVSFEEEVEIQQFADAGPLPDEQFERLERQLAIRQAMSTLDERSRTLLSMLFYESEPPAYAEIAARLGMPEGSVGPTRARCLQKLLRALETAEVC